MHVQETIHVERPPHDVFTALAEPEWQAERGGWSSLERSETGYKGVLQTATGPIELEFQCRFNVLDAEPDEHLRIRGQGVSPRIAFTIDARFSLRALDSATEIEVEADVNAAGELAGLGQRRLAEQARRLLTAYVAA
jgi:carbon monoxide dehydrogenase subunit G